MEAVTLERTLTQLDHARLLKLARSQAIEDLLDAATLVPSREVAPDVVTMHSQVLLQDCASGQRSALTLCYPARANATLGQVSVLSPVGSALLGLRAGDTVRWQTPIGDEKSAEIVGLLFQPESRGDYAS